MFGYKVENGTVVVNQSEAEIIIGIFNSYISGMSLREAAKKRRQRNGTQFGKKDYSQ